jgi:hypothetical protein
MIKVEKTMRFIASVIDAVTQNKTFTPRFLMSKFDYDVLLAELVKSAQNSPLPIRFFFGVFPNPDYDYGEMFTGRHCSYTDWWSEYQLALRNMIGSFGNTPAVSVAVYISALPNTGVNLVFKVKLVTGASTLIEVLGLGSESTGHVVKSSNVEDRFYLNNPNDRISDRYGALFVEETSVDGE